MNTIIDPTMLRRFHRTHISRYDFEDAIRFIRAARRHDIASDEYEALVIAAILAYARPFSPDERIKKPAAESRLPKHLVPFKGSKLKLHKKIINARNKAIAHSESRKNPMQVVPVTTAAKGFVTSSKRWHVVNLKLSLNAFEKIAEQMRQVSLAHQLDIVYGHVVVPKQSTASSKRPGHK